MADDKKLSIAELSILNAVAAKLPTTEGVSAERLEDGTWLLTVPESMAKAADDALKAVNPDDAKSVSLSNLKDILKRAVDETASTHRLNYLVGDAFPLVQAKIDNGDQGAKISEALEFLTEWRIALSNIEKVSASAKSRIDEASSEDKARQVMESLEWPE